MININVSPSDIPKDDLPQANSYCHHGTMEGRAGLMDPLRFCFVVYTMRYILWVVALLGSVTSSKMAAKIATILDFIQLEFIRKQQKSKNVYARHVDCKIF